MIAVIAGAAVALAVKVIS